MNQIMGTRALTEVNAVGNLGRGALVRRMAAPMLAVAAFFGPLAAGSARAQTSVDFIGITTSLNPADSSLTVDDQAVHTDGSTRIRDESSNNVGFSALQIGQRLRVRGVTEPGGGVLADRLEMQSGGSGGDGSLRFEGLIQAIDANLKVFTINGLPVQTTAYTNFQDNTDAPISFGAFGLGAYVKVKGSPLPGGGTVAGEVELEDDAGGASMSFNLKFLGTIESIDAPGNRLTVSGRDVLTTSTTRIESAAEVHVALADLTTGLLVEVKANTRVDGSILAVAIEAAEPGDDAGVEAELKGMIQEIDAGSGLLIVNGQRVLTGSTTVYRDRFNAPAAFGDLAVGRSVEIGGVHVASGDLNATNVEIEDEAGLDDLPEFEIELRGAIDDITTQTLTLVVHGETVQLTTATLVLDHLNEPTEIEHLHHGDFVEIEGNRRDDGSIEAVRAQHELELPAGGDDMVVHSTIRAIDDVNGLYETEAGEFERSEATHYEDGYGVAMTAQGLTLGAYVTSYGTLPSAAGGAGIKAAGTNAAGSKTASPKLLPAVQMARRVAVSNQFFVFRAAPLPAGAISDALLGNLTAGSSADRNGDGAVDIADVIAALLLP